jgi:hypothetical protein
VERTTWGHNYRRQIAGKAKVNPSKSCSGEIVRDKIRVVPLPPAATIGRGARL